MANVPKPAKLPGIVLAPAAREDIREALVWSLEQFGERAAARYRELVKQAIRGIASDPMRPGSVARPELAKGIRTYHLFISRGRGRNGQGRVERPRHFVVYRRLGDAIEVVRVLHDARELQRHVPGANEGPASDDTEK